MGSKVRSGTLASLALLLYLCTVLSAPSIAQESPRTWFRGEFNAEEALAVVYGRHSWDHLLPQGRNAFENGQDFIEPLYDAAYVEDGVDKHMVIAALTPKPSSQYDCRSCSPMLGGAVYRRDGDVWRVESTGLKIEPGHAWLDGKHGRLTLVRVSPSRYGVLHEVHDIGQGHEMMRASLIFGVDGVLANRLVVPPVEGPGPGACGVPAQHLKVDILEAGLAATNSAIPADPVSTDSGPGFYDIVVDTLWNEARCESVEGGIGVRSSGQVCQRISRYQYRDGTYVQTDVEIDICREMPGQTVDFRG